MERAVRFASRPLPEPEAVDLRARLSRAHWDQPFSAADPRETVRRVLAALAGLPVTATVFRGALDLRGIEVDHVWVSIERVALAPAGGDGVAQPYVLDAAFPLHRPTFIAALRRFVAGEASVDELEAAATRAGLDERVLGRFPEPVAYLGQPVWHA